MTSVRKCACNVRRHTMDGDGSCPNEAHQEYLSCWKCLSLSTGCVE